MYINLMGNILLSFITGLKQGCAALSDLSFVLVKNKVNNQNQLSFGIIAKDLQHEEGCYLPSFELDPDSPRSTKFKLKEIFNDVDMAQVTKLIEEYGLGSLKNGINMLATHIDSLTNSEEWGSQDYVFKLIITDIQKGAESEDDSDDEEHDNEEDEDGTEGNMLESVVSSSLSSSYRNRKDLSRKASGSSMVLDATVHEAKAKDVDHSFMKLLDELKLKLPKYYIHIPDNMNISVKGTKISFNYWQRKLVGLMRFDQKICEHESFRDAENFQEPISSNIKVRIFCGFDPDRVNETRKTKIPPSASLYFYSRKSGRLIKCEPDARNMLKLNASGTMYCQGLTCIIDDVDGQMPLNPTKQDLAFSEKRNGDILKENLYAWTGAILGVYYRFHLKKFDWSKSSKTELSAEVVEFKKDVKKRFDEHKSKTNNHNKLKSLAKADLLTLNNVTYIKKPDRITALLSAKVEDSGNGPDTLFCVTGDKLKKKTKGKAQKKTVRSTNKSSVKHDLIISELEPRGAKRARTSKLQDFREFFDSDDEFNENDDFMPSDGGASDDDLVINGVSPRANTKSSTKFDHLQNQKLKHDFEKLQEALNDEQNKNKSLEDELRNQQDTGDNFAYELMERKYEELEQKYEMIESKNVEQKRTIEKLKDDKNRLVEIKRNLQDENDGLNDEINFIRRKKNGNNHDSVIELEREVKYLKEEAKRMEKKFKLERSMREAIEEDMKAIKERYGVN